MELLESVSFPLNPLRLPNPTLKGDSVSFSFPLTGSVNSQENKAAIAELKARGCDVSIDFESQLNFPEVVIRAPISLFSPATVEALTARNEAEAARAATAHAVRAARSFDHGEIGVGC